MLRVNKVKKLDDQRFYNWKSLLKPETWNLQVNRSSTPLSTFSTPARPPVTGSPPAARSMKLFVFWILRAAKQHCRGGGTEGWDHPAAAPFSLSHSHLIPSFPLLFILQLQSCAPLSHSVIQSFSLSLSLFLSLSLPLAPTLPPLTLSLSLSLPLYLSPRHKDGWRSSWNGAHNRLCHKVSSLSCIRPSAAALL